VISLWQHIDLIRLWRTAGWLGVAATLLLSLLPPVLDESGEHIDKLVHMACYAMLMVWWAQLVTRQRWKLAVALIVYGIAVEGLQSLTPDRMPDTLDALANTAGVLLGWFAARRLPNLPDRLGSLFRRA
jgi:VanZ family protein